MAKIILNIEAENAFDLQSALRDLAGVGVTPVAVRALVEPAASRSTPVTADSIPQDGAPVVTTASETALPEPAKRVRRTKEQIAADEAAAAAQAPAADQAVAADAQAADVETTTAEPSDVTLAMVQTAVSEFMGAPGKSPVMVKSLFEANFKGADGTPAGRISALQPADYAKAYALLTAA